MPLCCRRRRRRPAAGGWPPPQPGIACCLSAGWAPTAAWAARMPSPSSAGTCWMRCQRSCWEGRGPALRSRCVLCGYMLAAVLEAVPMPGSFSAGTWHTILTRVPLRCSLKAGSSRKGSHPPAAAAVPVRLRRLPATARLGAAVSRGSSLLLSLAAAYPAQSVLLAPAAAPVVSVSKHPDVRHPPCSCLLEDGQRLAVLSDVQQLESELARSGSPGGWLQHTLLCTLRVFGRRERSLWLQP